MKRQDDTFERRLKSAVPNWAIATCAIMFCFALTVRMIGIDISTPINRIFNAKAIAIEGMAKKSIELEKRIIVLESLSHESERSK